MVFSGFAESSVFAWFYELIQEDIHNGRFKLPAALIANVFNGFFLRPFFTVGAVTGDGIPDICNGEDAGCEWDALAR